MAATLGWHRSVPIDISDPAHQVLCAVVTDVADVTDGGFRGEYHECVEFWYSAAAAKASVARRMSAVVPPLLHAGMWSRNDTRDYCRGLCDADTFVA